MSAASHHLRQKLTPYTKIDSDDPAGKNLRITEGHAYEERSATINTPISFSLGVDACISCRRPIVATAGAPPESRHPSTSATMASLWMATEIGGFVEEGLDVEVLSISSSRGVPALIANELDAVQISAAPVLTASLRGHDAVFVTSLPTR